MKREIKGMLTGLGVTFRTMLKPPVTVQYPHEREDPAPRSRGVIALKEENCTVTVGLIIVLNVTPRPVNMPLISRFMRTPPSTHRSRGC